ncbi:MAG: hypothetical protein QF544_00310 [Candidatus Thalassarchaeaceae archaeon]|nr:hypothetical protein [Candidatus Thalassarchaeaceae archaeon]
MALRKKKKNEVPPPLGSLPPPPPPGDLPPPPGLENLPLPPPLPSPKEPELPPPPMLPSEPLPPAQPIQDEELTPTSDDLDVEDEIVLVEDDDDEDKSNYSELWTNRTDKSLQQMYGHIDRLGSDDVGSLLERYADRFGHDLDREIIVMRKAEKESVRDTAPVVELISVPEAESEDDEDIEEGDSDLQTRLDSLEAEMRPLKKKFDAAKAKKNQSAIAKFGNLLKPMVDERKLLKGVISGDMPLSALDEFDSEEEDEQEDEDVDSFEEFFNVVNNLLGDMPESFINDFINSKNFKLFEKIGSDPKGASQTNRKKFFKMVNQELGTIPDDKLSAFMATDDFQLFIKMSEIYG